MLGVLDEIARGIASGATGTVGDADEIWLEAGGGELLHGVEQSVMSLAGVGGEEFQRERGSVGGEDVADVQG